MDPPELIFHGPNLTLQANTSDRVELVGASYHLQAGGPLETCALLCRLSCQAAKGALKEVNCSHQYQLPLL